MKKYIETVDGIVTQIVNVPDDKADRYNSSMTEVSVDVELGWTDMGDGTFSKVYTNEELAVEARAYRDALLLASDAEWSKCTSMMWELGSYSSWKNNEHCRAWATYRQALRDITGQDGFPENITWPTKPEENS